MKTFRRMIALVLLAATLSGCNLMAGDATPDTTRVMTTFYPLYAITLNLTEGVPALILSNVVQPQTGCPRSYHLSNYRLPNYRLSSYHPTSCHLKNYHWTNYHPDSYHY